ncbi:SIR2 family NAD-dependent protein deacylase [Rhodoplanes roseus]|uniref:SIR2 family protein n=1 Tax=Rhodoplanes roseus TaxID=29409 RepID=A0A327L4D5_9BRAD|nr:SIR2 family protein [Rhodoplanes roseus]RAI45920.1 SIR2 family protein [Rhodoplanes roseus]
MSAGEAAAVLADTTDDLRAAAGPERLAELAAGLKAGRMVPYLGPDLLPDESAGPPRTPEALALALHARAAVSSRIRGNLWATAQQIESRRHRKTLTALMADIFRTPVAPTPLHQALAALPLPLIVDTWYDGAMRRALVAAGRTDWGEIQGVTRAHATGDIWWRAYDAAGAEVDPSVAAGWTTILYKPHGSVVPAQNFLVSDSDYVEVLTEIDIQTPIPVPVQDRRRDRTFLFVGTRFYDQTLRIFARQIAKRSADGHVALVDPAALTRNEGRFLETAAIAPVAAAPADLAAALG